jgi:hypothetical protein
VTAQQGGGRGPRVYVHIGEPKTGTTFLQQVMWTNKAELRAAGLLLPGPRPMAHWRAAQDLRDVPQIPNDPVGPNKGAWDKLVRQVLRAPAAGVISHELLAAADRDQAERGIRSLAGAEVHVVLTVRDFASLLPAEWQETVKHRNTREWDDWLADVIDVESIAENRREFWFWKVHDTIEVLRTWTSLLPPEQVHVITVPQRRTDPDLLWKRFAGVVGIDPDVVDTARARSNASLGLAEVELLRRVNAAMPDELPGWFYMRNVKDALAHGALAARPSALGRLELPPEREKWAREHAETVVEGLRDSGYDIVGDLQELVPATASGGAHPRDARPEEMLDSAVVAISALLGELAKTQGVHEPAAPRDVAAAPARPNPVKAKLLALTERHPALHRLRRGYWHLANAARHLRTTARPGPSRGGD